MIVRNFFFYPVNLIQLTRTLYYIYRGQNLNFDHLIYPPLKIEFLAIKLALKKVIFSSTLLVRNIVNLDQTYASTWGEVSFKNVSILIIIFLIIKLYN
jgi:hypothetical protein